jgi:two-component sensor histidine kinase
VRNNLQLINDMLNAQLREPEGQSERGIQGIIRRVMTLAQVYDHLLGIGMSDTLDFGAYTNLLCSNLPGLQPARTLPITLICHAEKMILNLATVTALGLVVAELVSNSFEHAFPHRAGTIEVIVENAPSHRGTIVVKDNGTGYDAPAEVRRHGIGLVRRLVQQVRGTLARTNDDGTTWTVDFPMESRS